MAHRPADILRAWLAGHVGPDPDALVDDDTFEALYDWLDEEAMDTLAEVDGLRFRQIPHLVDGDALNGFADWLATRRAHLTPTPSVAIPTLPRNATRAEVTAWAAALEVDHLLALPSRRITGYTAGTLLELFPERRRKNPDWWNERASDYLTREAKAVVGRRAAFEATWTALPAHIEPLDALYQALRAHVAAHPLRRSPTAFAERVAATMNPPTAMVDVGPAQILLPLEPLTLPPDPEASLAVAAGLAVKLADDARLRERLAQSLAKPQWARDLDDLAHALVERSVDPTYPLVAWAIDLRAGVELFPVLATTTSKGKIKGKRVHAREIATHPALNPVERGVVADLLPWDRIPLEMILELIERLAGTGRVVRAGSGAVRESVALRRSTLQLRLGAHDDGIALTVLVGTSAVPWARVTEALQQAQAGGRMLIDLTDELVVVRCDHEQARLMDQLSKMPHELPLDALDPWLQLLPRLQRLVPLSLDPKLRGRPLPSDPRLVVRVRTEGVSVVVEMRSKPLPDAPDHTPGEPPETLHVVRDGLPGHAARDLPDELEQVHALTRELGIPDSARQGPCLWAVDDRQVALDVIRLLDPLRHRVELDEALPRVVRGSTAHLDLKLTASGVDWFQVRGKLRTELGDVALDEVLAAAREGRRYVQAGKKGVVHLEASLLAQAAVLEAQQQGDAVQVGAVHAHLLQQITEQGGKVSGPDPWEAATERLVAARTATFEVPEGLQAELRPYQQDGFTWLARQAAWTSGAVLADDMGLGKTVQAIALLLHRASAGPAMVVAPTSVVANWQTELARFATGLRVVLHHGAKRAERPTLGEADVLLTSYGVLTRDAPWLAETTFATLVVDEAQALKNPDALRSRAARTLQASFKVALSGTPVENHEVDLWSLFALLVPGLLGPQARFASRFASGKEGQRAALAAMIGPFVLRRTKRQVAPELPERQEVTHLLDMSEGHAALYGEALEAARERIGHAKGPTARFVTGQELMRLRQLACDPRLPDPSCPFEGPKVRWLARAVRDVVEGGEQVLVFSSYVGLLELAREALADLRLAWLIGSTAAAARTSEVARFQRGDADVFLISLKAGGVGLNLTAASYVFILDPWFNPAAEDQAADRAHRIGQDKKVTIYRGVARGTVEEKIRTLQEAKRAMVDELLEGAGSDDVLTPADLAWLLSGEAPPARPAPPPRAPAPPARAPAPPAPAAPPIAAPSTFLAWATEAMASSNLAASSQAVYVRALRAYAAWCEAQGLDPAAVASHDAYVATPGTGGQAGTFRSGWKKLQALAASGGPS